MRIYKIEKENLLLLLHQIIQEQNEKSTDSIARRNAPYGLSKKCNTTTIAANRQSAD